MPQALAEAVQPTQERERIAKLLKSGRVRRLVVTGNGAAYYAGKALWATALGRPADRLEVVCLPAGLLASRLVTWRPSDALLVVSSSGELRDVVEAAGAGLPPLVIAFTGAPESSIAQAARERLIVRVRSQEAVTHTQAFVCNVAAVLSLWAEITDDQALSSSLASIPQECQAGLEAASAWVGEVAAITPPSFAMAFGSSEAWPAALETALLLKEVAGIPSEGLETREGATSGMYPLSRGHLAISIPTQRDVLIKEAEEVCRRNGAEVLTIPGALAHEAALSPILSLPYALAFAAHLGTVKKLDIDQPSWTTAYYQTARTTDAGLTQETP